MIHVPLRGALALAFVASATVGCKSESEVGSVPESMPEASGPPAGLPSGLPSDRDLAAPTVKTLAAHVETKARRLAATAFSPAEPVPDVLSRLDYDQYRSIRFRPEAAIWGPDAPFQVQLFYPGSVFREPVRLHLVESGGVRNVPFEPSLFTFEGPSKGLADEIGSLPRDATDHIGYAGFRVHYPLNRSGVWDEVAVFQGASYLRLVGQDQVFGLSPRGLAVDIARESGEEFPRFREFWLVEPDPGDTSLVFQALLDGPSVTGSYRFELTPGLRTTLAVDARLFARRDVGKLGVAPLSSMFLFGPNEAGDFDDVRPEVHDSDGLLMLTRGGEWIWRPLANGRGLRVTSLRDRDPRGFGLVQRERDFERYLDLEAEYHRRPSVWVAIEEGDWGSGGVELLEIPTPSEFNDNIAAYWVPDAPFSAGEERHYRYRLETYADRLPEQTLAQVERVRIGWEGLPGQVDGPPRSHRRVLVDFSGGPLAEMGPDQPVQARLEASAGLVADLSVRPLPAGGRRASFRLEAVRDLPSDMRLYLTLADEAVSETWSYVWYPEQAR